ncbi:hypothetical protein COU75_01135 [Candidatus Peregrinibacteria bacterium CG10_big_fil_rev_8_21_14_0_10_42_8]|nr:MAG: hypothetical protein COU75_01135 [Candidatus Peregrinibacteria bacterium CG10_big_fil_rev_8_21_14_0_10_42_8]
MKNIFIIFLCASLLLCAREISLLPDGKMHLYILDVDQGDSFFVVTPQGKHILIDGGPNLSTLEHLGKYMSFFDRDIELVIVTHPDADHITSLPNVLHRYTVNNILLSGALHTSGRYQELLDTISQKEISVLLPSPTQDILIDGITLDIIWPPPNIVGLHPSSQNNFSIVTRMMFGNDTILFTGDIEEEAEQLILASGVNVRSTIMTAPHHGSRTSSSTGFLLEVNPDLILISAGKDNRYGHPHGDVLDRYTSLNIPIKTTPSLGTISMKFDGV